MESAALAAIQKQIELFKKVKPVCATGGPTSDPFEWLVHFEGPKGSDYENGKFHLKLVFPKDYPNHAPKVCFTNKVVYHPNVYVNSGEICVTSLNSWDPKRSVNDIIISCFSLFAHPNPNSAANTNAMYNYQYDKTIYSNLVKAFVKKYAQ